MACVSDCKLKKGSYSLHSLMAAEHLVVVCVCVCVMPHGSPHTFHSFKDCSIDAVKKCVCLCTHVKGLCV